MPPVASFLAQRLARAIFALWLVVTIVFVVLRLSGDPIRLLLPPETPPSQVAALRSELGFDRPIGAQYVEFLAAVGRGDLGKSLQKRRPALEVVVERLPLTAALAMAAFVPATLVGLSLGTLLAQAQGSLLDRWGVALLSATQASPSFVVAILLIWIVSVRLGWLPSSGREGFRSFVLPAMTLAIMPIASQARLTRSALIETQRLDYIRTARAKGLPERLVILGHAWRNAALTVITLLGLELGSLLTGAVIVESVFAWPGLGRLMVDSVGARDYPVVQAGVLTFAAIYIFVNLAVDCCYALLDPRISRP